LHAFNKVGRSIESEAEQIPPTSHSTKKGRKIRTTISTKAQHKKREGRYKNNNQYKGV
jgi:hypothetical protein